MKREIVRRLAAAECVDCDWRYYSNGAYAPGNASRKAGEHIAATSHRVLVTRTATVAHAEREKTAIAEGLER